MTQPLPLNRVIYRDYPPPISEAYRAVRRLDRSDGGRHQNLVRLADTSLAYFASVAFSYYRARASGDPVPAVEEFLQAQRNLGTGSYLRLLERASTAVQPAIFDLKQSETNARFPQCDAFAQVVRAIEESIRLEAGNLRGVVSSFLEQTSARPRLTWLSFWQLYASYRNRASGHTAEYQWPTSNDAYYEIVCPVLEAALVEALTAEHVERIMLDCATARLASTRRVADGLVHHTFSGTDENYPLEAEIELNGEAEELWPTVPGDRAIAGRFLLRVTASGAYEVVGRFYDLLAGPVPKPLPTSAAGADLSQVVRRAKPSTTSWLSATGTAPGTCGELAQGLLPDGVYFHVTCPITKSATVRVRVRPANEFAVLGLKEYQWKLAESLRQTAEILETPDVEIRVAHSSDLDIGKGMGSSTADVLAGARALAKALGHELSPEVQGEIAASVESSDGVMYPGIAAVDHKTGQRIREWHWWPQFLVVMIVPESNLNTESVTFEGMTEYVSEYAKLLGDYDRALEARDGRSFAALSAVSAALNQHFVPNPYYVQIQPQCDDLGAVGVNVGHTGTVCGVLFEPDDDGLAAASSAVRALQHQVAPGVHVELTQTPPAPRAS